MPVEFDLGEQVDAITFTSTGPPPPPPPPPPPTPNVEFDLGEQVDAITFTEPGPPPPPAAAEFDLGEQVDAITFIFTGPPTPTTPNVEFDLGEQVAAITFSNPDPPPTITGICDTGLTFDDAADFWDATLGLTDFELVTGALPAGYIQYDHITRPRLRVNDLAGELAKRCVAACFETSTGAWRLISKSLWHAQPNVATFGLDRFRIVEHTARSELREQLITSQVRLQTYLATDINNLTTVYVTAERDPAKLALYGDQTLDQTAMFVYLPGVAGMYREVAALLAEDVPLIMVIDVDAVLDDGVTANELWTVEPGQNLTFEMSYRSGVVTHVGTLINRRVFGRNGGKAQKHRLTIAVTFI